MPNLGHDPATGYNPVLVRDSDWVQTGHRADGTDWPAGTVITLRIGQLAAWPATISGPNVSWQIDKAQVNALIDQLAVNDEQPTARITYTDGTGLDLTLATGRTVVRA